MPNKLLISLILLVNICVKAQTFPYVKDWGTYYGGNNHIFRDAVVDSAGNIYIVSYVGENSSNDTNNYTTPNAHQPIYGGGVRDVFVSKFTPTGLLLWATYYGGEGYDYPSEIVLVDESSIYIVGMTTSHTNIATSDGYQTAMVEPDDIDVNESAGFIAKFSSEGELLYGTYYDGEREDNISSIAVSDSHIYIYGTTTSSSNITTTDSFQPSFIGTSDQKYLFIAKFTHDGERLWSTYYGAKISDDELIFLLEIGTMDIDQDENIYFSGTVTDDTDYYASSNAVHQPQNNGNLDTFISKFDTNGNRVWSTYYGGTSADVAMRLAVQNNNLYLSGYTFSDAMSIGIVYQMQRIGFSDDFLLKMDFDGQPAWSTYYGGPSGGSNRSYVTFGDDESVWLTGLTNDTDGIATLGSYQTGLNMGTSIQFKDAYFAKFTNSGQLEFASYYGGENNEISEAKTIPFGDDEFYIVGTTSSLTGIATPSASQETVMTDNEDGYFETLFIGKFKPKSLGIDGFNAVIYSLWPNPSTGVITLSSAKDVYFNLNCYDVQGRLVRRKNNLRTNAPVYLTDLSAGIYILEVTSESSNRLRFKVVFE